MKTTSDIKKGLCINYNNDIYKVIDFLHVKPGKGSAFIRTKLKSLTNGKIIDHTFSSGHKIQEVDVETRKYQYLYRDINNFYFMHKNDFSQIYLNQKLIQSPKWIKEGEDISIIFKVEDDTPLFVELPSSVVLEIIETEQGIKGNTATNANKIAIVETGAKILVPLFIQIKDKIKINTDSGTYIERIKDIIN